MDIIPKELMIAQLVEAELQPILDRYTSAIKQQKHLADLKGADKPTKAELDKAQAVSTQAFLDAVKLTKRIFVENEAIDLYEMQGYKIPLELTDQIRTREWPETDRKGKKLASITPDCTRIRHPLNIMPIKEQSLSL